ncbi:MAG: type II toxin-antitoxin system VapC family toxin [Deltaproteobacteria bacterium]|nr:type II toxin-antitoxin system VapC family toxin [Deltaproteobacteria bacterium]
MIIAVDTNILIDILEPDPVHGPASREVLRRCLSEGAVVACEVVWAEVATAYAYALAELDHALKHVGVAYSAMSRKAAMEAAKCWYLYRQKGGKRKRIAADFLIGGHALTQCDRLLTRDRDFFNNHFNSLKIISPS